MWGVGDHRQCLPPPLPLVVSSRRSPAQKSLELLSLLHLLGGCGQPSPHFPHVLRIQCTLLTVTLMTHFPGGMDFGDFFHCFLFCDLACCAVEEGVDVEVGVFSSPLGT